MKHKFWNFSFANAFNLNIRNFSFNIIDTRTTTAIILTKFKKFFIYRVVWKKLPILFFISKLCFKLFFHIFQVVYTAGLGDSFDTNMDPTGRYTTQQQKKIIEMYFATKSDLLTQWQCRRDLGRNKVPDGRTIQRLVANFRKTGSVADIHKCQYHSSFSIIPENIQNLQERLQEFPRKSTRCLSQETYFKNICFEDPPW